MHSFGCKRNVDEEGVRIRGDSGSGSISGSGDCVRERAGIEHKLGVRDRPSLIVFHKIFGWRTGLSEPKLSDKGDGGALWPGSERALRESEKEGNCGMNEPMGCSMQTCERRSGLD